MLATQHFASNRYQLPHRIAGALFTQWFRYLNTRLPEGTITHVGSTFQGLEERLKGPDDQANGDVLIFCRRIALYPLPRSMSGTASRHANKFYLVNLRPHIESGDAYHINRN